mgnify:CR=1 FL=1
MGSDLSVSFALNGELVKDSVSLVATESETANGECSYIYKYSVQGSSRQPAVIFGFLDAVVFDDSFSCVLNALKNWEPESASVYYIESSKSWVVALFKSSSSNASKAQVIYCSSPLIGTVVEIDTGTFKLSSFQDIVSPFTKEMSEIGYSGGCSASLSFSYFSKPSKASDKDNGSSNKKPDYLNNYKGCLKKCGISTQLTSLVNGFNVEGVASVAGKSINLFEPGAPPVSAKKTSGKSSSKSGGKSYSSSPVWWFNTSTSLGPVYIEGIAASFRQDELILDFYVQVQERALEIGLQGISFSLDFEDILNGEISYSQSPKPEGLSINYQQSSLQLSGEFLRSDGEYQGLGTLKAGTEQLGLVGGYSDNSSEPAMYLWGIFQDAASSPSWFDVQALGAGFGYNQRFLLPPVSEVADSPFIKALTAGDSKSDMARNPVPGAVVAAGEEFISFAVKGIAYQQIPVDAVAAVNFGDQLAIDLVGLMPMTLPHGSSDPLARAQLGLIGELRPEQGELLVEGQLLSGSYVLTPDCVLTGGFATASWFGDNSHSGDFVLTLGGYGRVPDGAASIPSYYPKVPRLGFNWHVSDHISIKGDAYFALTPSCMMAGGKLKADWHVHDAKAWFDQQADFYIGWQPYYYDAKYHVDIGAKVDVDCFFFDFKCSVNVGADVKLWGPEFSGKAKIKVCGVSIPFNFGADASKPPPLSWSEFKSSFLPEHVDDWVGTTLLGQDPEISSSSSSGNPIVNPSKFLLSINSKVPIEDTVYLTPCEEALKSASLTVSANAGGFEYSTTSKQLPSALWQPSADYPPKSNTNSMVTEYFITPKPAVKPSETSSIPLTELLVSSDPLEITGWPTAIINSLNSEIPTSSKTMSSLQQQLVSAICPEGQNINFKKLPASRWVTN